VREGAARALAGLAPEQAVPWLAEALTDPHLDVRKAAVISLNRCAGEVTARDALALALKAPATPTCAPTPAADCHQGADPNNFGGKSAANGCF
jgi:HEAT repeat protein